MKKYIVGIIIILFAAAAIAAGPYPHKQFGESLGKDGKSYKELYLKDKILFEGETDNDYEGTLTVSDVTADRTWTLPDSTGTVALTSDISDKASAMNGDATMSGNTITIGANAITTSKIGDNAVTVSKIAANAVTTAKILDGAVNGAKLGGIAFNCGTGDNAAAVNVTNMGFASSSSYRCTVNNNSAARVVSTTRTSGAVVQFSIGANAVDTIGYMCLGN